MQNYTNNKIIFGTHSTLASQKLESIFLVNLRAHDLNNFFFIDDNYYLYTNLNAK